MDNKFNFLVNGTGKGKIFSLFFLFSFILILSSISAITFTGTSALPNQLQGSTVFIIQSCDNSTYSNISSILVGSTIIKSTTVMPQISVDYYVYNLTDTQTLGTYIVNGYCDENGVNKNWAYSFDVTSTGIKQNSLWNNPVLLILLSVSMLFLILGLVIKSYPLGFISGIMFCISGMYTMIYGFNNYTDDFTRMVALVIIGLGIIFILVSAYEGITDSNESGVIQDEEDIE